MSIPNAEQVTAATSSTTSSVSSSEVNWLPFSSRKTSIWSHFLKHPNERKCMCSYCRKVLSTQSCTTTTLKRHLSSCHSFNSVEKNAKQESKILVAKLVSLGISFSALAEIKKTVPRNNTTAKRQKGNKKSF